MKYGCGGMQRIVRTSSVLFLLCGFHINAIADIDWQPCAEMPNTEFECATLDLPLNHQKYDDYSSADNSDDPMVRVSLARLPSTGDGEKKGSLFLNPGGPGGSGVNLLFNAGHFLFTEEVRRSYDLIGFDPRGIDRSDELTCFSNLDEMNHYYNAPFFPLNQHEVNQRETLDQYLADLCASRAGDMINHMSTADVARDLDLLRQAVGDEKLNFVGYSYGSYLGVTYANLFPENVGAMVIDGVIDPIAWSTGRAWSSYFFPFTTRIRSAEGAQDTLTEFLRLCEEGGVEACPLAGGAESRLSAVLQAVQDEPFIFVDEMGEQIVVDYTLLVTYIHSELYSPDFWPQLAFTLATIEEYYSTGEIAAAGSALIHQLGLDFQQPETMLDQPMDIGFYGVSCSDSDNPYYYDNWAWAAEVSESLYQYFGSYWTWRSSACHAWPTTKESRYTGGFRVKTENPVLVVNNLYDPATPYHGAEIVNKLLRNSRLLTVNGWGHPSMHLSACAGRYVADYLLTGSLPEKGARCDADVIPFRASLDVSGSARQRPFSDAQNSTVDQKDVHSELIKEILPHRFH